MPETPAVRRRELAEAVAAMGLVAVAGSYPTRAAHAQGEAVRKIIEQPIPDLPNKVLTAVVVEYAPGGRSPPHRHGGSVFAFVISGSIRSQLGGGEATIYRAGQSWFEPPGTHHLVSENASATQPASLLAVIIADAGARTTVYDR